MHGRWLAAGALALLSTVALAEGAKQYDADKLYVAYEKADPMEVLTAFQGPLMVSGTVAKAMATEGKVVLHLKTSKAKEFVQLELAGVKVKPGDKISAQCDLIAGLTEGVLHLADCVVKK